MTQQEPNSLTPEAKPGTSIEDFMQEVQTPTTAAPGTTLPTEPPPVYHIPNEPPPSPEPAQERPTDEPMFRRGDGEQEQGDEPIQGGKPPRSNDYKAKVIRGLITAEEFITARICAISVGSEEISLFKYSEDDKETLQILLEPFEEWILDKCPAILPVIMVYGGLKTDQIWKAVKEYKRQKANAAARLDKTVQQKVNNAAAAEGQKPRTNFKINKKGEYIYDRYGKYLKADEVKELAHIADLDRILESNKPSDVKAAFNLTDEQLAEKGIEV